MTVATTAGRHAVSQRLLGKPGYDQHSLHLRQIDMLASPRFLRFQCTLITSLCTASEKRHYGRHSIRPTNLKGFSGAKECERQNSRSWPASPFYRPVGSGRCVMLVCGHVVGL